MEKAVVAEIMKGAKTNGWYAVKNHGSIFSQRGMPDVLVLIPARPWAIPIFVETKRKRGIRESAIQKHMLQTLCHHGAFSFLVQGREEAKGLIAMLLERYGRSTYESSDRGSILNRKA